MSRRRPGAGLPLLALALALVLAALAAGGCASVSARGAAGGADVVEVTLLHLNDVYEITPVEGGRSGGLARVATLRRRLLAENPNTFTLLAGDFLSPSALGTARVDGQALAGKQMVAVLGAMGLDVATFGNHEFDVKESQLRERLAESRFRWTSANVAAAGEPFAGVSRHEILEARNRAGATLRIGVVGVTLDSNRQPWVTYADSQAALRAEVAALQGQVDVVVALTHLAFADDAELAAAIPEVDLVLGGHEHENVRAYRGADFTPVLKADANARSVYVHRLRWDARRRRLETRAELRLVTDAIPDDPQVAAVVAEWVKRGYAGFRAQGFEPEDVVARTTVALDGREASVRNRSTNLTELIARAFLAEVPGADLSLYNSGSIRVDDVLTPGPVTQYDVIRVLPFGGLVQEAEIQGSLLSRALAQGAANVGSGGYLQSAGASLEGGAWTVGGAAIDPARWYRVAISDYLAAGKETNLGFLAPGPEMRIVADHRDVRLALIDELRRAYPASVATEALDESQTGRSTVGLTLRLAARPRLVQSFLVVPRGCLGSS